MSTRDDIIRAFTEGRPLGSVVATDEGDKAPKSPLEIQARVLTDLLPHVIRKNPFKRGDLIKQSTIGGSAYRFPGPGSLAIVTDTFVPLAPCSESQLGEHKRWDREDIVILCEVEGRWVEFTVASWRFEKYEGPVE